jgi:Zn-dependent protease with chaperone function
MEIINLAPLPYHEAIRDFLKSEEARVWEWFASHTARDEQADAVRFDLLKKTYRIERTADRQLYTIADEVMRALSLNAPITIYQSQSPEGLNAALAYVPNEIHIVFSGPIKAKLSELEIRAVLGHELTHYSLWHAWNGEYLIADQILAALTHDEQADTAHFNSARLFQLYNEIFCDRGSLSVVEDPLVVVSTLVKLATGLDEVNAESYIRQAEEVYSREATKTAGLTHPEAFIRARAVKLWHERDDQAAEKISQMIEGALALDELDLLGQQKVSGLTRRLIDELLTPGWLRTDLTLAHARLFFPEYAPPTNGHRDERLLGDLRTNDKPLQDYYCYVLLDFATADRELEEAPLASALGLIEKIGLKERFLEIAKKELRLTKKQLDRIDREKESMVELAAREAMKA